MRMISGAPGHVLDLVGNQEKCFRLGVASPPTHPTQDTHRSIKTHTCSIHGFTVKSTVRCPPADVSSRIGPWWLTAAAEGFIEEEEEEAFLARAGGRPQA